MFGQRLGKKKAWNEFDHATSKEFLMPNKSPVKL